MNEPTSVTPPPDSDGQPGRIGLRSLAQRSDYLRLTTTLTYSYLFVLPLIVLYEAGSLLMNAGAMGQIRIGADVFVKRALELIGIGGTLWVSVFVLAIGAGILIYERRHNVEIRPRYFAYMFGESIVYAIAFGMLVQGVVAELFSLQWPPLLQIAGRLPMWQGIVLSLGAGIYEELVFRLLLVSALVWLLTPVKKLDRRKRYAIAAVIGALIFSAVHYIGALGDTFELQSFTFRFLMGLVLNGLFIWRGFGIAAMTHAMYDVFVTLLNT